MKTLLVILVWVCALVIMAAIIIADMFVRERRQHGQNHGSSGLGTE